MVGAGSGGTKKTEGDYENLHTDVQYVVKVDLIQIINLAVYVYILFVLR